MRSVILVGVLLLFMPVRLFAQGPAIPMDWYSSVGGVVAFTLVLVGILKRLLGRVSGAKDVPTWIYAVGVSALLTYLAHLWGTLEGTLATLMMQAVLSAASASGLYEWYHNSTKPLSASAASAASRRKS